MHTYDTARAEREFINYLVAVSPPHMRQISLAMQGNAIALAIFDQHAGPCDLPDLGKPLITIIGDDVAPGKSLGPQAFHRKSIRKIARHADLAIINAIALDTQLYEFALTMATVRRWNVLMVETRMKHEKEWTSKIEAANPAIRFVIASASLGHA